MKDYLEEHTSDFFVVWNFPPQISLVCSFTGQTGLTDKFILELGPTRISKSNSKRKIRSIIY